jgi:uncharacterized protein YhaN
MRFQEIRLLKYGNFEERELLFEQRPVDFHFIEGPNEAGKSTTVSAVSDFLFGFPNITEFDFRFDRTLLRVGAVVADGDEVVSLVRKKGNTNTLLDENLSATSGAALLRMLGGQDRESFLRMFSLDHGRLRSGGDAMLEASDDVGQTIFAAGSGLIGVTKLLAELDNEAKKIWAPQTAKDRLYYMAKRDHDEAKARLNACRVKSSTWRASRDKTEEIRRKLEALRNDRAERQAESQLIYRRLLVLPPIAQLKLAEAGLSELGDVPNLPPDAATTLADAREREATAQENARQGSQRAEKARQELADIVPKPRLLAQRDAIRVVTKQTGAVEKGAADLPKRRAERHVSEQSLAGYASDIGWPDGTLEAVQGKLPGSPETAAVLDLLENKNRVDALMQSAVSDQATRSSEAEALTGDWKALPQPRDVSALKVALRLASAHGDLDAKVADVEQRFAEAEAKLQDALARLSPWTGQASDLEGLAVPADAETARLGASIAGTEKDVKRTKEIVANNRKSHEELELRRRQLIDDEKAVPPEEIEKLRRKRDEIWQGIDRDIAGGAIPPHWDGLSSEFQAAVADADALADRRFQVAEQSGRLVEANMLLGLSELALQQAEADVAETEAALASAQAAWVVATSAIVSLPPASFETWRERRNQALVDFRTQQRCVGECAAARENRNIVRSALLSAFKPHLGQTGEILDAMPIQALVAEADRVAAEADREAQQRVTLEVRMKGAVEALRRAKVQADQASADAADWDRRWTPTIERLGLRRSEPLASIRAAMGIIGKMREQVTRIKDLDEQCSSMEDVLLKFGESVRALAAKCGIAASGRDPGDVLKDLQAMAEEAQQADQRRIFLEGSLKSAEEDIRKAHEAEASAVALLRPLMQDAGVETRAALAQAIDRSNRARTCRQEITRWRAEVVSAGDGATVEALIAANLGTSSDDLRTRSEELKAAIQVLNDDIASVGDDYTRAMSAFEAIDDRADAAVAMEEKTQAQAEMEFQVEAYVCKRAQASLLRWTIERYRRERQAPLLKRAAQLFSRLTLCRYVDLSVETDGVSTSIVGILAGGANAVPVGRMSQGTLDQLYLALRLAAVESVVDAGLKLPFLADDLFINFDNDRAEAGFKVLGELATKTQVLFFSHHGHLLPIAEKALKPARLSQCTLA